MSATAIVVMIAAMALLWGGLVVAIVSLIRHDSSVDAADVPRDL